MNFFFFFVFFARLQDLSDSTFWEAISASCQFECTVLVSSIKPESQPFFLLSDSNYDAQLYDARHNPVLFHHGMTLVH